MIYHYAYLWDKGEVSPQNRFVLAVESVMTTMTTNGQVLLALLTESEQFARMAVAWLYEEGLPILRERGMCRQIRSTFLRNISEEDPGGTVLLLYGKQFFSYSSGQLSLSIYQNGESPKFTNHIEEKDKFEEIRFEINNSEYCKFGKIKAGDSALLYSDSMLTRMDPEVILRKLISVKQTDSGLDLEESLQKSMDEVMRRIRSRGEKEEIAAIFIRMDKK